MDEVRVPVSFSMEGNRSLSLRDPARIDEILRYLAHRVVDDPADLRSHVQRVLLLREQERGDELEGAITDLYIALQARGRGLKDVLLDIVQPVLSERAMALFRDCRDSGFGAWDVRTSSMAGSVLTLGFSGTRDLLTRAEADSQLGFSDAVEEARSCLEYGQVEAAREVLEWALRQDPENPVLASELLEIYDHTRDDERRAAMREFLLQRLGGLPSGWDVERNES